MEQKISLIKDIDLSLSERDITSLLNISNSPALLNSVRPNSLVLSIYDENIYRPSNDVIYSYQFNNLLFVNNDREFKPLTYNINNINSAFTIDKNKYTLRIDNNTIIEKNNVLAGSYNHIPIAKNHIRGRSSYDDSTLTLDRNRLTFTNKIIDKINIINDYLKSNEFNVKLNIYTNVLENFKIKNTRYLLPIYSINDSDNALTLNTNHITYKDKKEITYDISVNTNNLIKIDYGIDEFNLILRFNYKYISDRNIDYNYYTELINKLLENNIIISNNKISIDKDKSYIFDITKTYFDLDDNLDIEITSEFKYNVNFKINYRNIGDKYLTFNINILNNVLNFILLLDTQSKLSKVGNIIYYDRYHGYNFDEYGKPLGICIYPQNYFTNVSGSVISVSYHDNNVYYCEMEDEGNYISDDMKKYKKPIYVKMSDDYIDVINVNINKNNIKNIIYNITNNFTYAYFHITTVEEIDDENQVNTEYYYNLTYKTTHFDSTKKYYNVPLSLNGNIQNNVIVNKDFTITYLYKYPKPRNNTYVFPYINYNNNNFEYINPTNTISSINSIYSFSLNSSLFENNINSNEIYYLPSLYDLEVFNGFGLQYFLKKDGNESIDLSSKIFYKAGDMIYNYKIQENNRIIATNIDVEENSVDLKTRLLFTIPDLNILYGDKYYILYDIDKKHDVIRSLNNESFIKLNMQRIGITTTPPIYIKLQYITKKNGIYINNEFIYCSTNVTNDNVNTKAGKMILTNLSVTSSSISFNLYNHSSDENILTFYYKDSNDELNDQTINENVEGNYKILCQLIVKK